MASSCWWLVIKISSIWYFYKIYDALLKTRICGNMQSSHQCDGLKPTGECPWFNIELSFYYFTTQLVILDTTLEWRLNPLKKFIPKWFNPIRSNHNIGLALRTIKKKEVVQIVEQDGSSLTLSLCHSASVGIKNGAKKHVITWPQVTLSALICIESF